MKYIISYNARFGTVSIESKNPEDLRNAYPNLKKFADNLEKLDLNIRRGSRDQNSKLRKVSKSSIKNYLKEKPMMVRSSSQNRGGGSETSRVLREIESKVIPTSFFGKPRTTGETKARLVETSGTRFASRKVSQALGILWKKQILKRSGTRNYFAYSK